MLIFENISDQAVIRKAFEDQQSCEFSAAKGDTAFANGSAPDEWTAYPIGSLPPENIAIIFAGSGTDHRGMLTRLEVLLSYHQATVEYRVTDDDRVLIRFFWRSG